MHFQLRCHLEYSSLCLQLRGVSTLVSNDNGILRWPITNKDFFENQFGSGAMYSSTLTYLDGVTVTTD
jgi:hypothetical protein